MGVNARSQDWQVCTEPVAPLFSPQMPAPSSSRQTPPPPPDCPIPTLSSLLYGIVIIQGTLNTLFGAWTAFLGESLTWWPFFKAWKSAVGSWDHRIGGPGSPFLPQLTGDHGHEIDQPASLCSNLRPAHRQGLALTSEMSTDPLLRLVLPPQEPPLFPSTVRN